MKEYIEKAVALEALSKSGVTCNMRAHKIVASIQAADVAPVRHGRWIVTDVVTCSECQVFTRSEFVGRWKYCPNCGARMGKEDEYEAD